MSALQPFSPKYGSNQVVSPSSSSATISIDRTANCVQLWNTGSNICHVRTFGSDPATFGGSALTGAATTADFPVPAGARVILTKSQEHDKLAHISASGTTLHVMTGEGWV